MQCPFCFAQDTRVIDSRLVGEGEQVRRRRNCMRCDERFTTYETVEFSYPRMIKQDGRYEKFEVEKLRAGMMKAMEKRPVSTELLESAIHRILNRLRASGDREMPTKTLGLWVMQELRSLDEVAYVRFASIYRAFQDVEEFRTEIANLKKTEASTSHDGT